MADPFGFGAEYGEAEYGDAEYGELAVVVPPAPAFTRDVSTPVAAAEAVINERMVYTPIAQENAIGPLLIIWNVFNRLDQPLPIDWNVIDGGLNASLPVAWDVQSQPLSLQIVWNVTPNLVATFVPAQTTLAAPYVAGGTSIVVTSAAGFPGTGVFHVVLGNGVVFRVDSVSGTTFTGAAVGFDADAAAGTAVSIANPDVHQPTAEVEETP